MSDLQRLFRSIVPLAHMLAHPLGGFPNFELEVDPETAKFVSDYLPVMESMTQLMTSLYPGFEDTIKDVAADAEVVLEELDLEQLSNFISYCRDIYLLNEQILIWAITEDELDRFPPPDVPEDADQDTKDRHTALMMAHMLSSQIAARWNMFLEEREKSSAEQDSAE